ncbi:hypothetical protein Tco_1534095 [Tanacetum coccineum]
MNGIEMGKHEAVWSGMTEEICKDVMDYMFTMWKRLMDENPSVASNVRNTAMDTSNDDTLHVDDPPIVQSLSIQDKPRSYVKINDVPIHVFSEDVLSIIVSQIESLTMGVPLIHDSGFTIETVSSEYEWKPPCFDLCKIFGHVLDHCPKKVSVPLTVVTSTVVTPIVEQTNDGFKTVGKKKKKGKSKSTNSCQFSGHSVKHTVRYEPKATTSAPKKSTTNLDNASKSSSMLKNQPPRLLFLIIRKVISPCLILMLPWKMKAMNMLKMCMTKRLTYFIVQKHFTIAIG